MTLKSIKDVVILLEALKDNNANILNRQDEGQSINLLADWRNQTSKELEESMKTEIETLNKAIAILEKESE
jgi:hypothetical protein